MTIRTWTDTLFAFALGLFRTTYDCRKPLWGTHRLTELVMRIDDKDERSATAFILGLTDPANRYSDATEG